MSGILNLAITLFLFLFPLILIGITVVAIYLRHNKYKNGALVNEPLNMNLHRYPIDSTWRFNVDISPSSGGRISQTELIPRLKIGEIVSLIPDSASNYDYHAIRIETHNSLQIGWYPEKDPSKYTLIDALMQMKEITAYVYSRGYNAASRSLWCTIEVVISK